jgi:hypothetical protein
MTAPFASPPSATFGGGAGKTAAPAGAAAHAAAAPYGPPRSRKEVTAMIFLIIWLVRQLKRRNAE